MRLLSCTNRRFSQFSFNEIKLICSVSSCETKGNQGPLDRNSYGPRAGIIRYRKLAIIVLVPIIYFLHRHIKSKECIVSKVIR